MVKSSIKNAFRVIIFSLFVAVSTYGSNGYDCSKRYLRVQGFKAKKLRLVRTICLNGLKPTRKNFNLLLRADDKIIFYTLGGIKKSNYWVTGAILNKSSKLREYKVISDADQIPQHVDANTYIVLLDDASYTDTQLFSYI